MTTKLITFLVKMYNLLITGGNLLQSLVLLAFRLAWGIEYFIDGQGKLKNHADIVAFFTSLHIPFPDLNAWFVGGLELVGGVLLVLGFLSRPIGLLLLGNMTVAFLSVDTDRAKVFDMFKNEESFDAFTQADPFFFWLTALVVLAFGSGAISLDNLLAKTVFKSKAKTSILPSDSATGASPAQTSSPATNISQAVTKSSAHGTDGAALPEQTTHPSPPADSESGVQSITDKSDGQTT